MYCLIVISAGSLSLLKQLLTQMFSTLARPSNCSLVKEYPPSTLCPISSQRLLESVPTLERASGGVCESEPLHYAYLR